MIKLSENDFEYLYGNNILSESSQIMAFGSSSQYIINKTPKTKANEINTKEIIKVRNSFYNNSNINEITTDLVLIDSIPLNDINKVIVEEMLDAINE